MSLPHTKSLPPTGVVQTPDLAPAPNLGLIAYRERRMQWYRRRYKNSLIISANVGADDEDLESLAEEAYEVPKLSHPKDNISTD